MRLVGSFSAPSQAHRAPLQDGGFWECSAVKVGQKCVHQVGFTLSDFLGRSGVHANEPRRPFQLNPVYRSEIRRVKEKRKFLTAPTGLR